MSSVYGVSVRPDGWGTHSRPSISNVGMMGEMRSCCTSTEPVLYDSGWAAECTDDQGTRFCLSVPADKYTR